MTLFASVASPSAGTKTLNDQSCFGTSENFPVDLYINSGLFPFSF